MSIAADFEKVHFSIADACRRCLMCPAVLQVHQELPSQPRCHQRGEAPDVRFLRLGALGRLCYGNITSACRYKLFKQVRILSAPLSALDRATVLTLYHMLTGDSRRR